VAGECAAACGGCWLAAGFEVDRRVLEVSELQREKPRTQPSQQAVGGASLHANPHTAQPSACRSLGASLWGSTGSDTRTCIGRQCRHRSCCWQPAASQLQRAQVCGFSNPLFVLSLGQLMSVVVECCAGSALYVPVGLFHVPYL
jgi:hypothetical protein